MGKKDKTLFDYYKECFRFLSETKKQIYIILLLFAFFIFIGYFANFPLELEELIKQTLKEIFLLFE